MKKSFTIGVVLAPLTIALVSQGAEAQEAPIDPIGIRAGAFTIFPSIPVETTYNDNIFKTASDTESDFITTISPQVAVRSNWSRHLMSVRVASEFGRYADSGDDDYVEYNAAMRGRIDVSSALVLNGALNFTHDNEERGDDDSPEGASEPGSSDAYQISGSVKYKPNRFAVTVRADAKKSDFDDVSTNGGGTVNNDDRDRTVYNASIRTGYDIQDGYEAYVQYGINIRDYDVSVDDTGLNRNSDGYDIRSGLAIDLTRLLRADLAVGYKEQSYDDPTLSNEDTFFGSAQVRWRPTPLLTVRANLRQTIDETTAAETSGKLTSNVGLGASYEILRNLVGNGDIGYRESESLGDPLNRTDKDYTLGLGLTYKPNRFVHGNIRYDYETRDSNIIGAEYDQNRFTLGVTFQY